MKKILSDSPIHGNAFFSCDLRALLTEQYVQLHPACTQTRPGAVIARFLREVWQ